MSRATVKRTRFALPAVLAVLTAGLLAGCQPLDLSAKGGQSDQRIELPKPIDKLMPQEIRFHPFTETRTFDEAGGIKGIEVLIKAIDAYGDPTKAFGTFRFEMYTYRERDEEIKGERIVAWQAVDLSTFEKNRLHWSNLERCYKFQLRWDRPIPVGRRFVLRATFSSPFTDRLFTEHVFVAGQ